MVCYIIIVYMHNVLWKRHIIREQKNVLLTLLMYKVHVVFVVLLIYISTKDIFR